MSSAPATCVDCAAYRQTAQAAEERGAEAGAKLEAASAALAENMDREAKLRWEDEILSWCTFPTSNGGVQNGS